MSGSALPILVIDDNPDITDILRMALEMLGYEPRVANSGTEGISLAAIFNPPIILLDIGLQDMSGYEVAKSIRKESWGKDILLIAATGWGDSEDRKMAIESGFDKHLTKPIDLAHLEDILKDWKESNL